MWISKTPLRISLFSGGDMAAFYKKHTGVCLSGTIDKYVYVSVSPNTNGYFRTMHETIDNAINLNEIKNVIIRETLDYYGYDKSNPLTISSVSDIPTHGSGLGSSSAFTVGLVANLTTDLMNHIHEKPFSKESLASEACRIEIERCKHPIGKQDQYAAAYGGFNMFKFHSDESVEVIQNTAWNYHLRSLQDRLLLVYTGVSRKANDILKEQEKNLNDKEKFAALQRNGWRADMATRFLSLGALDNIGEMLHDGWEDKKTLATEISNSYIDEIYEIARKNGAIGGKLIGAGGGGFMLLYVPGKDRRNVIDTLPEKCKVFDFEFVDEGCKVFKI